MISRCSSPIPEMSVCPVSWSVRTRNVGSSSDRRCAGGELVLVALGLRLDRDRDHRLGEVHRLELDRRGLDRERLAGRRVLQADQGGDLAGLDLLALLAVVRVHLEDAADPLIATGGGAGGRALALARPE